MDFVAKVLEQSGLLARGWWIFLAICLCISFYCFGDLHRNEQVRGRWVALIRHDRIARRYRAFLDAGLNRLDEKLSPGFSLAETDHDENRKTESARAWSFQLLNLCLLVAVAYPVLGFLAYWTVTGATGRLGSLEVIPAEPVWWRRWLPWVFLAGAVVCGILARRAASNRARLTLEFAALGFAGAFAFAGAVLVVGAGVFAQEWIGRRYSVPRLSLLVFSVLCFVTIVSATRSAGTGLSAEVGSVLLFIGILPLLNAWADFASVGLTRWRLRCGVQGHLVTNAVIDAVAAVAILLILAFGIIAAAYLAPSGASLIDFPTLFADLRGDGRGQYWWLGFMLFSTLLPTLIHLSIGAFALFTVVSGRLG